MGVFRCTWRTHFSIEVTFEKLRKDLCALSTFNPHDAFMTLDYMKSGILAEHELQLFLKKHRQSAAPGDLKWIIKRFDKAGNGQINYQEFLEEI